MKNSTRKSFKNERPTKTISYTEKANKEIEIMRRNIEKSEEKISTILHKISLLF